MTMGHQQRASTSLAIRGSLIDASYARFREWSASGTGLERHVLEQSSLHFGSSESANEKIQTELRRRFDPTGRDLPLAVLAAGRCAGHLWRPILLWHLARTDVLLRDFLLNWLYPRYADGVVVLRADDVRPYLAQLPPRGLLKAPWSEETSSRVASQLLHVAADFGILKGKLTREFALQHLPDESFLYVLHALVDLQPNAREVVQSPDWRIFLMDADDVERELFRLHQFRRVHYEVAGSLAQLKLPCSSAVAYARELVA